MSIEKILVTNFNYLKEKSSLSTLGVKNSNIFICKIPYFNKNYYLIKNNKKEYIKIKFTDNTEIEINAKTFMSHIEPISIKVACDSSYQSMFDLDSSLLTLKDFKPIEKRYKDYPLKFANQKEVDNYFINDYLIEPEKVQNHLFKIPVSDRILNYIKIGIAHDKLIANFDTYSRVLPSSMISENCIYTNSHTDCLIAIEKISNLTKGIPNLTIHQLKKQLHSKIYKLSCYVNSTVNEDSLLKFESDLDKLINE